MKLQPGQRLASPVSDVEVVVVRAGRGDLDLRCGGVAMVDAGRVHRNGATVDPAWAGATPIGKRWEHHGAGLEVLVTKAGIGLLSLGQEPLVQRQPKPLPASD